jgi:hypothetical protein
MPLLYLLLFTIFLFSHEIAGDNAPGRQNIPFGYGNISG